jgi:hypothetical protein
MFDRVWSGVDETERTTAKRREPSKHPFFRGLLMGIGVSVLLWVFFGVVLPQILWG